MKHQKCSLLLFVAIFIGLNACKKNNTTAVTGTIQPVRNVFVKTIGNKLFDSSGNALRIQGAAFGNEIWGNVEVPLTHHNEQDFIRLKAMKMNAVRFYLNYKTFESDNNPYSYKQSGWDWIDQNIAWAKKYGIYLILNMHAPQGGYQSQGNGDALWNELENQNRLTSLWKAIATKYKNEPTIIGYGLVNEPVPVSSLNQWQQLAQRITNSVRQADTNHLVFVEKPIYIKNVPGENADLNFPIIADSKVVYEFHFYDPIQYTHQLFTWANLGEGGGYPDENIISYSNGNWYTATFNNPVTPAGNTDWRYYEGVKYTITDPNIKLAVPALVAKGVAPGTIYFDNISIKEFDANGVETGTILTMNLNSISGWGFWSQNNTGASSINNLTGNGDNNSIAITGATDDCNVSNYDKIFIPKQGYSYQMSGWMKGEQIPASANCQLRIDFITTNNPILKRNKAYLLATLQKYIDWSTVKNVPIYMGEFGAGKHCFTNNKGGIQWVTDMLDICTTNNIYFTYHAYHEDSFGIYFGDGVLPQDNNANQPLIDLFKLKLR